MTVKDYAVEQFNLLNKQYNSSQIEDKPNILYYENEILGICTKIENQGYKYPFKEIDETLFRLINLKPIVPILNRDEDWVIFKDDLLQHKFCDSIFKDKFGIYDRTSLELIVQFKIINDEVIEYDEFSSSFSKSYADIFYLTKDDALNKVNGYKVYIKKFPYIVPLESTVLNINIERIDNK